MEKNKFDDLDKLIYGDDEFILNSKPPSSNSNNTSDVSELSDNVSHLEDDNIDDGEVISLNHQVKEDAYEEDDDYAKNYDVKKNDHNSSIDNVSKIEPWQQLVQDELKEFSDDPIGKDYEVLSSKPKGENVDLDEDFGIKKEKSMDTDNNSTKNSENSEENIQILSTDALGQTRNLVEQFKKIVGDNVKNKNVKTDDNQGEEKFEGNIENLIRPMIASWLDDNLPNIVKKIVLEEIKKIT